MIMVGWWLVLCSRVSSLAASPFTVPARLNDVVFMKKGSQNEVKSGKSRRISVLNSSSNPTPRVGFTQGQFKLFKD